MMNAFRLAFVLLALVFAALPATYVRADDSPTSTQTTNLATTAGANWQFCPEGGAEWKPIVVPGSGWRAQGFAGDAGTYHAMIPIPLSAAGRDVRVVFEAVNFGAEVSAGPDAEHLTHVASHVGGWMPVAADVTHVAVPGQPLLLQVEVAGRRKFRVNGTGKYTIAEGATWDPFLADGILRGVSLQIRPKVCIDDAFVQTRTKTSAGADAPTISSFVRVTNASDRAANVRVMASLRSWNGGRFRYPTLPVVSATLPPGESQMLSMGDALWTAGAKSYWWPNVPYRPDYHAQLHDLDLTLTVDGKIVHTYRQRFGFRSLVAHGDHYELNDVRCNLRGDNQQEADFGPDAYGSHPGFAPPTKDNGGWPQAVDNLLSLNFNVLRIHQIPATRYMLDVCDERGLMLVDETPLRGSDGGESFEDGRDNMLRTCRELAERDRNHPAVVVWSALNEWRTPGPIREAIAAMRAADNTRPIISDGGADIGPDVINMQHYVNHVDGFPADGATPRTDRPYGETEAIWSHDNTRQGFAWMATSVRLRRLKGDSDLRNYVLNNAWSNYVPGETPETMLVEKKLKHMGGSTDALPVIPNPNADPNIRLMRQCYAPLTACDIEFDQLNARSNAKGEWPTVAPTLTPGASVVRHIAVFNDEFAGEDLTLRWAFHQGTSDGTTLVQGESKLRISLGAFQTVDVPFTAPNATGDVTLILTVRKDGRERFREDRMRFQIAPATPPSPPVSQAK